MLYFEILHPPPQLRPVGKKRVEKNKQIKKKNEKKKYSVVRGIFSFSILK